jgi:hypothetical protein
LLRTTRLPFPQRRELEGRKTCCLSKSRNRKLYNLLSSHWIGRKALDPVLLQRMLGNVVWELVAAMCLSESLGSKVWEGGQKRHEEGLAAFFL